MQNEIEASTDSLKYLQHLVLKFVSERDWDQFHSPKNLAMSIAIESAEICELFQWLTNEEASKIIKDDLSFKKDLSYELADVLIYCLSLSARNNINLGDAIREKIEINRIRFPIQKVKGKAGREITDL